MSILIAAVALALVVMIATAKGMSEKRKGDTFAFTMALLLAIFGLLGLIVEMILENV